MPATAARVRLEIIDVPNPCPADWSAMKPVDGERVRFCRHCDKHVYNLTALPRDDAEQFMGEQLGNPALCVRLFKRHDGTVVTADCRGKWRSATNRFARRWGGPVGVAISLILTLIGCGDKPKTTEQDGYWLPGEISPPVVSTQPTTQPVLGPTSPDDKR